MDRITSQHFLANGRRVTRGQVKIIKTTFPFLQLPAELRNIVYDFCGDDIADFAKLKSYFDKCFEKINAEGDADPHGVLAAPYKQTPTIFLINKQISREASFVYQNQSVSFHRGLLKNNLADVISPNILRQVSSLEITDAGHPMIDGTFLPTKWAGYMRLFKQLGNLLSSSQHKLKKLTIKLDDPKLVEHMTHCHIFNHKCGFRDQMSTALAALGKARGVKEVVFHGLNDKEAAKLQKRMQAPAVSFLSFPRELRDMIYVSTADWSDSSKVLGRAMANWSGEEASFKFPSKTTPTILLINKQISAEALKVVHKRPLNIVYPAAGFADQAKIPSILGFITRNTMQNVTTINVDMQCWQWVFNIDDRLGAVLAASKKLKHFTLHFNDSMKKHFLASNIQSYPDLKLTTSLKRLLDVRGLESATFTGDLPEPFSKPLQQIMESTPSVPLSDLPKLKAVFRDGFTEDIDERDQPDEGDQSSSQ